MAEIKWIEGTTYDFQDEKYQTFYSADPPCRWFWGSHGCDLPEGHDGDHACEPTSKEGPYDMGNACFVWSPGYEGEFYQ